MHIQNINNKLFKLNLIDFFRKLLIEIKNKAKPKRPTSPTNSIRSEWAWLAKEFDKFGNLNWNIVSKLPAPYPKIK